MTAYIESDGLRLRRKVRALVLNENDEVLLVRPHGYRDGEWTLAGGGVEEGESPVEAMRRELAEELGVGLEAELERSEVKSAELDAEADGLDHVHVELEVAPGLVEGDAAMDVDSLAVVEQVGPVVATEQHAADGGGRALLQREVGVPGG